MEHPARARLDKQPEDVEAVFGRFDRRVVVAPAADLMDVAHRDGTDDFHRTVPAAILRLAYGMPAGLTAVVVQTQALFTVLFAALVIGDKPKPLLIRKDLCGMMGDR
jgi:hypothetical protein